MIKLGARVFATTGETVQKWGQCRFESFSLPSASALPLVGKSSKGCIDMVFTSVKFILHYHVLFWVHLWAALLTPYCDGLAGNKAKAHTIRDNKQMSFCAGSSNIACYVKIIFCGVFFLVCVLFFLNKDATGQKSKDHKSHINRNMKEVFYCLLNFLKENTTSVVSITKCLFTRKNSLFSHPNSRCLH